MNNLHEILCECGRVNVYDDTALLTATRYIDQSLQRELVEKLRELNDALGHENQLGKHDDDCGYCEVAALIARAESSL